ncbi:PilZ domain-containing protein [Acidithiobacillus sp.]|uniref:PilZ domain-containing protein n=1 Tax=Acidithiobacillus sp. TaxID=1872118 RepID=UPI00261A3CA9|nr:PilZ domain-containing protein [Acidithiobacillus sp.]MDD2750852.1 PilZ domain-containing protein [Acidithiobacillus sp.]MDD5279467.1 PilZ domain-containing protein [Acidithiobacillus sp.]
MASSESTTNDLSLILPPRAGQAFREYLQVIEKIFQEIVQEDQATLLSAMLTREVIVFSAAEADSGQLCSLYSVSSSTISLKFSVSQRLSHVTNNERIMVIIGYGNNFYAFFAKFLYNSDNIAIVAAPLAVYKRSVRKYSRINITEPLKISCKNGQHFDGEMADFSPTGIRFIMPTIKVKKRDTMLVEFTSGECGTCETLVQVTRSQRLSSGTRSQVAVRMLLTRMMKNKMEYMYWCCRKVQSGSAQLKY